MTHIYDAAAHAFDAALSQDLKEAAEESAKAAEDKPEDGLRRIAENKTPLEEVKAIIAARKKTAEQDITEYSVRRQLRKHAAAVQHRVVDFVGRCK